MIAAAYPATVMPVTMEPGMTVWHEDTLRTVAEVYLPRRIMLDKAWIRFTDGARVMVDRFREFPIYWTPREDK